MLNNELREYYKKSPMKDSLLCWYPYRETAHIVIDPHDLEANTLKSLTAYDRVVIAYENPFALRHFATGFANKLNLPSKAELSAKLMTAGFASQKWYYLLSDHYFVQEIYSDNYMPNEFMGHRFIPYVRDDENLRFDERPMYREIVRNGAFSFMCGAYFIEVLSNSADAHCAVDYGAITMYRKPANRFATTIRNDGTVRKTPLHYDGIESIRAIFNNHQELRSLGLNIVDTQITENFLLMFRIDLPTVLEYWAGDVSKAQIVRIYDKIRDYIFMASKSGKCFWELVPANCFYDESNDDLIFFDQEFYWDGYPPEIALARALMALEWQKAFGCTIKFDGLLDELKMRYGLVDNWNDLLAQIHKIGAEVFGDELSLLGRSTDKAMERIRANRNMPRFDKAIAALKDLGVQKPAIYGFGKRGKEFCAGLIKAGITDVTVMDRKFADNNFDAIIVSILNGGDSIANELRKTVKVPVYTLGELHDEITRN